MTPIFRWNGEYFGFISNENLFDSKSNYLGWVEDNMVWRADGTFLGEILNDNYILRRINMTLPAPRISRISPVPPIPPIPRVNRVGRIGRAGWKDALDDYR